MVVGFGIMSNRIVTVFGGSGFLGRHLIQQLAQEGALIRVAVRRPEFAGFLRPMGGVGQITLVQANVRNDDSVARAIEGANEVVNLTGILYERNRQRFDQLHSTAPCRIASDRSRGCQAGTCLRHRSKHSGQQRVFPKQGRWRGGAPRGFSSSDDTAARNYVWTGRRFF